MLLQNTTCLVTGASGGIGAAICKMFAQHGARMVLTGRDINALDQLAQELPQFSQPHLVFCLDVACATNVKEVFRELQSQKIFINCLVNNAGIMEDAILQFVKVDSIINTLNTNIIGTIIPAQEAIKPLLRSRGGTIINLSSIIGTKGSSGQTIYSSSKAAVVGFTKSLSKELAPLNIRVNAIAPGFIETNMTTGKDEKFYERNKNAIGMKRFGNPEDVAKVALFLASDLSCYVTGQVIGVDGGMII